MLPESRYGLEGLSAGEVGADSALNPMALKISSLGEMDISLSNGVMHVLGASFGTARNMVPPEGFTSTRPVRLHLLFLTRVVGADVLADDDRPNIILLLVKSSGCVASVGESVPLRLKMETLRLAMLDELGS